MKVYKIAFKIVTDHKGFLKALKISAGLLLRDTARRGLLILQVPPGRRQADHALRRVNTAA
jgi:hypothetical protein